MQEFNDSTLKRELKQILETCIKEGYNEIFIIEGKPVYFYKYINGKLDRYIETDIIKNVSRGKIQEIFKDLNSKYLVEKGLNLNTFIDSFKESFYFNGNNQKFIFRLYTAISNGKYLLNIKIIQNKNFNILEYLNIKDPEYSDEEKKKKFANNLINPFNKGLYVISSNQINLRKNFYYAIIEHINNIQYLSKINIYEELTEKLFKENKALIIQRNFKNIDELKNILMNDARFFSSDVFFIEYNINEEILNIILQLLKLDKKIFILFNGNEEIFFEKLKIIFQNNPYILKEELIDYFQYFIYLNKSKKIFIKTIIDKEELAKRL